ncbi:reverse transcriptase domain-containing protein [Trichonephila clavata]|uniref:Reverse transcriptase domain-containing protein n=1 Tax=Trichonephila clavata TaxID=2740835 RepID=A0A8X6LW31_TRICU|nr:reverse transcriptase domain-containing protein [Trichonephila clavata]
MKILEKWCRENQMIVNTERTVYQLFTLSTKKHPTSIKYMNLNLVQRDHFSYLGATFDNRLSWKGHAEENARKRGDLASSKEWLGSLGNHLLMFFLH